MPTMVIGRQHRETDCWSHKGSLWVPSPGLGIMVMINDLGLSTASPNEAVPFPLTEALA